MQPRQSLPDYDAALSSFHTAFEHELSALVNALPLSSTMRVLDLACGDGFYTQRLAERLGSGGHVTGADVNRAYLEQARSRVPRSAASVDFVVASFDALPFPEASFDFVWCAQSLFSLPDPVVVLRHVARVVRPAGIVAILENDSLHQVFLPWPVHLELPLRAAELAALSERSRDSNKYYVGRRLPEVLSAAGFEPAGMTTHAFDRSAPFREVEAALLQRYLEEVTERVSAHLEPNLFAKLRELVDPASPLHLLKQPHLTMTWLNVLALGRKPDGG